MAAGMAATGAARGALLDTPWALETAELTEDYRRLAAHAAWDLSSVPCLPQ